MDVVSAAEVAWRKGAWVAGFLSYESAGAFDPALRVRDPGELPLAWFAIVDRPAPDGIGRGESSSREAATFGAWTSEWDASTHAAAVERARQALAAGEGYQLNLTHRLRAPFEGDGRAAWEALQQAQRGSMGAWLDLGRFQVGSASPELFFHWDGERIVTRPMKGTSARGMDAESDLRAAMALQTSAKERAENAMIVDLLRNDLGRIAQPGSVQVERLFELERYPTVWQLTSTISARTRPGIGLEGILSALFPCGSITGAPKVRTMELIRELERSPRGLYCGAIGLLAPDGTASFNVAIRTLTFDRERKVAEYGTGGGITWDSRAEDEWRETLAKARVLTHRAPDFDLLETLRLEDGIYPRRREHLARLLHSSELLGFEVQELAVLDVLDALAGAHPRGAFMVRLTASHPRHAWPSDAPGDPVQCDGDAPPPARVADAPSRGNATAFSRAVVTQAPVPGQAAEEPINGRGGGAALGADGVGARSGRVEARLSALPQTPIRPRVEVHREALALAHPSHKTTLREPYDRARAAHPGAWDVILRNAEGQLTEFTRGNLVVVVADGRALTPPLSAGLLPGTMRARLLAEGRIVEHVLTVEDLVNAREVRFVNDLRGELEVDLALEPVDAPSAAIGVR